MTLWFLRKTVDKYRFEYDGDNDQIGVEDLESKQVVVFQNVEHFRVDGLKVDGSRAVDVFLRGGISMVFQGQKTRWNVFDAIALHVADTHAV